MREPDFWHRPRSLWSDLLRPLGALYGLIAGLRLQRQGFKAGVPVICVGNYHLGGAGKTPTVLAFAKLLNELGETPVVLSRGYGGERHGPVLVDPGTHTAREVGDEPLMLAQRLQVVVARDRLDGLAMARSRAATVILMDDGFQNPAIVKDAAVIVIDSHRGIGNGQVFPAGPLRAPLAAQVARTDALVVIGMGAAADKVAGAIKAAGRPVFPAQFKPDQATMAQLKGRRALAFAGIGDPARFFRTLTDCGIEVSRQHAFPDHHSFSLAELQGLVNEASRDGLVPVTTEKDFVRLRSDLELTALAKATVAFPVTLQFDAEDDVRAWLADRLFRARRISVASS